MNYDELLIDNITVLKRNGELYQDIKANVEKDRILILQLDVPVGMGDIVQRHLSDGPDEVYEVLDPGYHRAYVDLPAGYLMKTRRMPSSEAEKTIQSITANKQ